MCGQTPQVTMATVHVTHNLLRLAQLPRFVSINSAVEIDLQGVLSTSNRKPPLRIPLRRVAKILTHPGQVEMISPKWVDMLAHERSDVAQRFVSNLMALGT